MAEIVAATNIGSDDCGARAGTHDAPCVRYEELQRNVTEHTHVAVPGREIEMRRVELPNVFQDVQGLAKRQQLSSQLFLDCQRCAESLHPQTRQLFCPVGADGLVRSGPR